MVALPSGRWLSRQSARASAETTRRTGRTETASDFPRVRSPRRESAMPGWWIELGQILSGSADPAWPIHSATEETSKVVLSRKSVSSSEAKPGSWSGFPLPGRFPGSGESRPSDRGAAGWGEHTVGQIPHLRPEQLYSMRTANGPYSSNPMASDVNQWSVRSLQVLLADESPKQAQRETRTFCCSPDPSVCTIKAVESDRLSGATRYGNLPNKTGRVASPRSRFSRADHRHRPTALLQPGERDQS